MAKQDPLEALRLAIERVGRDNLIERRGLARNVLGDMLPGEPLAVAVLSAAVEQGAVSRLLEERADTDVRIVVPRLAGALADARGLVPERAVWAISIWALALGFDVDEPPPLGSSKSAPAERGRSEPRKPVVLAPLPPTSGDTHRRSPQTKQKAERTGRFGWLRWRWLVPAVAGTLTIALVVVYAVVSLSSASRAAMTTAGPRWASVAELVPVVGAKGQLSKGANLASFTKRSRVTDGTEVQVQLGPAEVTLGSSVVRLGSDSRAVYEGPTKKVPPSFDVGSGDVFVNAAPGQQVALNIGAAIAYVTSGRLSMHCDPSSCTLRTLDESQRVVSVDSSSTTMHAHQTMTVSRVGGEKMDMNRTMTGMETESPPTSSAPSNSAASGGMAGMAPAAAEEELNFVAPDILRNTPWLMANDTKDRAERRHFVGIDGVQLVGKTWTLMFKRSDVPANFHRALRVTTLHCEIECLLIAHTKIVGPDGTYREVSGRVRVGDAHGSRLTLVYDDIPARCGGVGAANGMERIQDSVELAGAKTNGARLTTFMPNKGVRCPEGTAEVASATVDESWDHDMTADVGSFTAPSDTEALVQQHVLAPRELSPDGCVYVPQRLPGVVSDVRCTYLYDVGSGPKTVEYRLYKDAATLAAGYRSILPSSVRRNDGATCKSGACERPIDGGKGRQAIFGADGAARMLQYDSGKSLVLVDASGASARPDMAKWQLTQDAFDLSDRGALGL